MNPIPESLEPVRQSQAFFSFVRKLADEERKRPGISAVA
jgi:hypothetical protein